MNKFKMLLAVLMCSFVIMAGATIGQKASASIADELEGVDAGGGGAGGLSCSHLTGCNTSLSCPGRGTANGCIISCAGGGTIGCNIN